MAERAPGVRIRRALDLGGARLNQRSGRPECACNACIHEAYAYRTQLLAAEAPCWLGHKLASSVQSKQSA
jgi:hypothetical protein